MCWSHNIFSIKTIRNKILNCNGKVWRDPPPVISGWNRSILNVILKEYLGFRKNHNKFKDFCIIYFDWLKSKGNRKRGERYFSLVEGCWVSNGRLSRRIRGLWETKPWGECSLGCFHKADGASTGFSLFPFCSTFPRQNDWSIWLDPLFWGHLVGTILPKLNRNSWGWGSRCLSLHRKVVSKNELGSQLLCLPCSQQCRAAQLICKVHQ